MNRTLKLDHVIKCPREDNPNMCINIIYIYLYYYIHYDIHQYLYYNVA